METKREVFTGFGLEICPKHSRSDDSRIVNPQKTVPLLEPEHWPTKVVIIAPEQPLGSFRTGTMNFSAAACRKWMTDGHAAGIRAIVAAALQP